MVTEENKTAALPGCTAEDLQLDDDLERVGDPAGPVATSEGAALPLHLSDCQRAIPQGCGPVCERSRKVDLLGRSGQLILRII